MKIRLHKGDLPGGVEQWDASLVTARGMGDRYGEAQTLWGRGRTYAHQPNPDLSAAVADLDRAVELLEAMEARPSLARALQDRSRALSAAGRADDAARDEQRSNQLGRELGLRDFA